MAAILHNKKSVLTLSLQLLYISISQPSPPISPPRPPTPQERVKLTTSAITRLSLPALPVVFSAGDIDDHIPGA